MTKDYKNMIQEELEKELAEIVRKNYEKGVLLLDHNFDINRLRAITETADVEDIDEIISILHSLKNMPNMKKYFLEETDVVEYRLIDIVEDCPVNVLIFPHFSNVNDEIMQMYFHDRLKDIGVGSGTYYVVQMLNGKFIGTLGTLFYNEDDDSAILDCAEDNDCVICENAYKSKDIYREATKRLLVNKCRSCC